MRALEEHRRRVQSFARAAAKSYGNGSSLASTLPRSHFSKSRDERILVGEDESLQSSSERTEEIEEQEVQSPLKGAARTSQKGQPGIGAHRQLVLHEERTMNPLLRKRKSKNAGSTLQTCDLNVTVLEHNAIVPSGLVNSRVH